MKVLSVKAKVECNMCGGNGCYDCKNKGFFVEHVTMEDLYKEIKYIERKTITERIRLTGPK